MSFDPSHRRKEHVSGRSAAWPRPAFLTRGDPEGMQQASRLRHTAPVDLGFHTPPNFLTQIQDQAIHVSVETVTKCLGPKAWIRGIQRIEIAGLRKKYAICLLTNRLREWQFAIDRTHIQQVAGLSIPGPKAARAIVEEESENTLDHASNLAERPTAAMSHFVIRPRHRAAGHTIT